jgi:hypothetical protein
MAALFASQFDVQRPYQPDGLDTGVPEIGLTLPSVKTPRTPEEETPTEKTPTSTPQVNNANARATAQAQAQASALTHAESMAPVQVSAPVHATVAGAQAAANAPSGIGHWVAHTFDSARHGVSSALDTVNNAAQSNTVKSIMDFGDPFHGAFNNAGIVGALKPAGAQAPAPVTPQPIRATNYRLNPNSPVYDEPASYPAMPRGWSANAVGPSTPRVAIEGPNSLPDPLQSLIHEPSYSAVPRGWSANVNPIQFNSEGSSSALPRGLSANGGWLSDAETVLGDIADSL